MLSAVPDAFVPSRGAAAGPDEDTRRRRHLVWADRLRFCLIRSIFRGKGAAGFHINIFTHTNAARGSCSTHRFSSSQQTPPRFSLKRTQACVFRRLRQFGATWDSNNNIFCVLNCDKLKVGKLKRGINKSFWIQMRDVESYQVM